VRFFNLPDCALADVAIDVSMVLPVENKGGEGYRVIGKFFSQFCTPVPESSRGGLKTGLGKSKE
jgi:hypothetical protein